MSWHLQKRHTCEIQLDIQFSQDIHPFLSFMNTIKPKETKAETEIQEHL